MKAPAPPQRNSLVVGALFLAFFVVPPFACASSGAIDSTEKYAWSNVGGWVNFAPTNSLVIVSDTSIIGVAWSANDGWINLAPSEGGVTNNGSGTLGGWAWDQSAGWISFTGVTIDSSGRFHGQATGANGYIITFNCANCDIVTNWRPAAAVSSAAAVSGGAIIPPGYSTPNPLPGASIASSTPSQPATTSPVSASKATVGTRTSSSGSLNTSLPNAVPASPLPVPPTALPLPQASTSTNSATVTPATTSPPTAALFSVRHLVLPVAGGISLIAVLVLVFQLIL